MNSNDIEDTFTLCDMRKHILDKDGHMLVVGGPGSGKTTIALLKARRYILGRQLDIAQKVLFLSFSNAAIRRIMESAGGILTGDIADRVDIKTYHSFTREILMSHGYLTSSKRRIKVVPVQDADIRKAGLSEEKWEEEQRKIYVEEGLATFDQFAPRAVELLKRSRVIRTCFCATYPLILVDEFQDTDKDQWALIQLLSEQSKIVGLGDSDQQIFEWRHGVSEARLEDFNKALECDRFDFANENNRSPAKGIASFARALLSPGSGQDFPNEITRIRFRPILLPVYLHIIARKAFREAKKQSGKNLPKIAIAARSNRLVRQIADALDSSRVFRGNTFKPLMYDVRINQGQIFLASRVIANIISNVDLEHNSRLEEALSRIANMFRAKAKRTHIETSDKLQKWADKCRSGKPPKTKCVTALTCLIKQIKDDNLTGVPRDDWITVRELFEKSGNKELEDVAKQVRYLRLLRRGSAIEQTLITLWVEQGNYKGAEAALERAILQVQLLNTHREDAIFSVMNMHQLKGREYDAIVLVEDQYNTFMAHDRTPPHINTRRLLHMSLTRAREAVFIISNTGKDTFDQLLVQTIPKNPNP